MHHYQGDDIIIVVRWRRGNETTDNHLVEGGYFIFENKIVFMNDGVTISNKSAGNILSVEIDGDQIHTWTDYVLHIEKELSFPSTCVDSMDRYLDWMTDLSWLDQFDGFEIIIKNYSKFMRSEPKLKNEIINDFEEIILPFWEKEVQYVVVGGKPKSFNLGLID